MSSQSIVEECVKAVHRARGFAVLATERDGQPHASFIAITPVEGFRHLIFATYRSTRKYRNLADNGKVAVLIDGRATTEAGVQDGFVLTALGRAEEVNAEENEAAMRAHVERHPDLESFLRSADCALVRVTVSAYQVVRAIDDVTWWHIDDHLAFSPQICDNGAMDAQDHQPQRPLIIGYGNPYRQDDRVGHIVAEEIQRWADTMGQPLDVVTAYQLDLDMVEQISAASLVVFVDAHKPAFCDGVACAQVVADDDAGFTTHAFTPGGLLALATRLKGRAPHAFIVSVPGYAFDLGEEISAPTRAGVAEAVAQVQKLVTGI